MVGHRPAEPLERCLSRGGEAPACADPGKARRQARSGESPPADIILDHDFSILFRLIFSPQMDPSIHQSATSLFAKRSHCQCNYDPCLSKDLGQGDHFSIDPNHSKHQNALNPFRNVTFKLRIRKS